MKVNKLSTEFTKRSRSGSIHVNDDVWEYVAGNTFIAVRMSPEMENFSPTHLFVMERISDDLWGDVEREINKRFYSQLGA